MSKKSKSKSSSSAATRHSLTIRSKVTLNRILEATSNSVKIEINEEGRITGRYTGTQLDTLENTAPLRLANLVD